MAKLAPNSWDHVLCQSHISVQKMGQASAEMGGRLANKGLARNNAFPNLLQINTSPTLDVQLSEAYCTHIYNVSEAYCTHIYNVSKAYCTHIYNVLGIGLEGQAPHVDKME